MNTMSSQTRKYELKARAAAQEATRARIAVAAASLHEEVGIARASVSDIARRAGVQRLTVYNNFPNLETLLPACSAHWLSEHPLPDFEAALASRSPAERLRGVLVGLYLWYGETAPMQRRLHGERSTVPELDAWMAQSADRMHADLADALAGDHPGRDARALLELALDFWTWERLNRSGLDDDAAADLLARMIEGEQVERSVRPPR